MIFSKLRFERIMDSLCDDDIDFHPLAAFKDHFNVITNYKVGELIISHNPHRVRYLPERFKTKRMYMLAMRLDHHVIRGIPLKMRTIKMIKIAVSYSGLMIRYAPDYMMTDEIIKLAVKNDGLSISYVPDYKITSEIANLAFSEYPDAFEYIPDHARTYEMIQKALRRNGHDIKFINLRDSTVDKKIREEYITIAIKTHGESIEHVPKDMLTQKIVDLALNESEFAIKYVPKNMINEESALRAAKKCRDLIRYIPKRILTEEFINDVLDDDLKAFENIPDSVKTEDIVMRAVKNYGMLLEFVPKSMITREVIDTAIASNREAIIRVPAEFLDEKIALELIDHRFQTRSHNLIRNIPERLLTPNVIARAVYLDFTSMRFVPKALQTFELCVAAMGMNRKCIEFIELDNFRQLYADFQTKKQPNVIKIIQSKNSVFDNKIKCFYN